MANPSKHGFTLVELTTTLIIIGLIIAAITSGSHLLDTARINKIISEIDGYATAINNFETKYYYLPGDIPNADEFWGTDCKGATSVQTYKCEGNGDKKINISFTISNIETNAQEPLRAWQHLALSELIAGNLSGEDGGNGWEIDANLPASAKKGGHYFVHYTTSEGAGTLGPYFSQTGIALQLASNISSTNPFGAILTPEETEIIDEKIDDGEADDGNVLALRGNDIAGNNICTDASYTTSSGSYKLDDYTESCRLLYWVRQDN